VDNRSNATTIRAVQALIAVQGDRDLSPVARKLLSFTDNRQDASLQAGHFNDFAQVALLRSALYRACEQATQEGLRHGDLSSAVRDAMNLHFNDFAADPEVRGPARQSTEDALRRVLEYFLYRDLERGWRVTAPNLEDCGLLRFEYEGLRGDDGLLAEKKAWDTGFAVHEGRERERFIPVPDALRLAPADLREEIVRTLLDVIRRALAVKVDVLDPRKQHDLVEQTKPRLLEGTAWYLDDERELTSSVVAWPRSGKRGERRAYFVSSYGAYGQYLRRTLSPHLPSTQSFGRAETDEAIRFLFLALKRYAIIEQFRDAYDGDAPAYHLIAAARRWCLGDGAHRQVDTTPPLEAACPPRDVSRSACPGPDPLARSCNLDGSCKAGSGQNADDGVRHECRPGRRPAVAGEGGTRERPG